MTVPGAGGSGQAVCPAGAADCRLCGGSGQGEDCDAVDRVGAGMAAAGALGWLAGGAATTFGRPTMATVKLVSATMVVAPQCQR